MIVLLSACISASAHGKGTHYDVVVSGGTPGGIASAISAARLGHTVALVEYHGHLGGMSASGLGKSDIETAGAIGGIWDEFVQRVLDYYVTRYGAGSQQVEACRKGYFYEPSVAEGVFNEMVKDEPRIHVYLHHRLAAVQRSGSRVTAVEIVNRHNEEKKTIGGKIFIDGTYEGDLAAWAGLPYRLGRESRREHDEPHAGVIYMDHETRSLLPGTTGAGDDRLVAYTYRLCLSSNPGNRVYPARPDNYDPDRYKHYLLDLKLGRIDSVVRALSIAPIPNEKYDANMKPWPLGFPFAGENSAYPEGDWETREAVMKHLRDMTLGLVYWLQNDPAVPPEQQAEALRYGLAADEFTDNSNFPFQLYVREARRIQGEYTLTEHDLTYAPEQLRAPIHESAVSSGEFPIDSFPTRKYEPGHESALEGYILMLNRYTQPYQIPYGVMVSRALENLLFPVPASATHIAFSSVRLEPTWMSLGQAAGTAAHLSLTEDVAVAAVPILQLQRMLVDKGAVLTYFKDLKKGTPHFSAIQFWGTKGFFEGYEARAETPLDGASARAWIEKAAATLGIPAPVCAWRNDGQPVGRGAFLDAVALLPGMAGDDPAVAGHTISRGEACGVLYAAVCSWLDQPV